MKIFGAAVTLSTAFALNSGELKYMNYMASFGKEIANMDEFRDRLALFNAVDLQIEEHNAGVHSYTLGHNQFSDWSTAEKSSILGHRPQEESRQ